jgi:hypothetical protein
MKEMVLIGEKYKRLRETKAPVNILIIAAPTLIVTVISGSEEVIMNCYSTE